MDARDVSRHYEKIKQKISNYETQKDWNKIPMGYVLNRSIKSRSENVKCGLCFDEFTTEIEYRITKRKGGVKANSIRVTKTKGKRKSAICPQCFKKWVTIKNKMNLSVRKQKVLRKIDLPYWQKKYAPLIDLKVIQLNILEYDKRN